METKQMKPGQVCKIISDAFQMYYQSLHNSSGLMMNLGKYDEARFLQDKAGMVLNLAWEIEKCVKNNITEIGLERKTFSLQEEEI